MILIAREKGSKELLPLILRNGVKAELYSLPYGDFAFEGNGPNGPGSLAISIERKTLHDMLDCIDTHRYSAHQKVGMRLLYTHSYLAMEGIWRPHDPDGWLMEGHQRGNDLKWAYCKPGGRPVLYSKLRRYLFSVALGGVEIIYTRDMFQTAFDLCEMWHYFQKPWEKHTALLEMQKIALPDLRIKPPLVRRWAKELTGIGLEYSLEAETLFKQPWNMANADESAWMGIGGIGAKTARKIVKEIRGWK